jgi:hypothetical protein
MGSLTIPRRRFLLGLASLAVCAPAVVRASSLMRISAELPDSALGAPTWSTQDALALLQHEMERRFAETLFGAASSSEEAEIAVPTWSPFVAEARTTALWELRTWFGPRGSPPRPLEQLPPAARAGLRSIFAVSPDVGFEPWSARIASSAARTSA